MATTGHESELVSVAGLKATLQAYKTNITDTKLNANLKGAANGVAELDENGKVPSSQLPAYVDDVIEGYYYNAKFYKESTHTTEITGEGGKIYVDLSTSKTYRWSGSAYAVISDTIAIGTTTGTAADGKVVADHTANTTVHITASERTAWNAKGSYSKPSGGIPKSDLASAVQTSLGKADTAVQTETDPVFSASAAADITSSDITNWNGKTSNTGTVTKVTAGTGLSIGSTSGGNFTTTGTINHTNSVTAQSTQAIYPIKIDAQGHISAYGSAVTPLTASSTLDATKLSGTIPAGCYTNTVPSAYCETAAGTAAKTASCTGYALLDKSYIHVIVKTTNTNAGAITLNINSTGAKSIYINGAATSSSNYTLTAGSYLVYYADNIFYFRTDGKSPAASPATQPPSMERL